MTTSIPPAAITAANEALDRLFGVETTDPDAVTELSEQSRVMLEAAAPHLDPKPSPDPDLLTVRLVIVTTHGTVTTDPLTAHEGADLFDLVGRAVNSINGSTAFDVTQDRARHGLNGRHVVEWYYDSYTHADGPPF